MSNTTKPVNFSVATQANAHRVGFQDALELLVVVLEESGDINHMLDVMEDNMTPELRKRFQAHYETKAAQRRKELGY